MIWLRQIAQLSTTISANHNHQPKHTPNKTSSKSIEKHKTTRLHRGYIHDHGNQMSSTKKLCYASAIATSRYPSPRNPSRYHNCPKGRTYNWARPRIKSSGISLRDGGWAHIPHAQSATAFHFLISKRFGRLETALELAPALEPSPVGPVAISVSTAAMAPGALPLSHSLTLLLPQAEQQWIDREQEVVRG
jgi:hypothetical protein